MTPRILLNVVFFAILGGVLSVWAATSLLNIDAIDRPFTVTAEFTSSPGLYPDLQVTYLGVPVGRVASVDLLPGKVAVKMKLDHDAKVPAPAGAQVLRKSAIGEPYIELTAPAEPATGTLKAGDTVPLARTSGTVDYQDLFDRLGKTLNSVNPEDTRVVVHELATGVQGHGDTLRDLIGDADRLTGTLAANAGLLDHLSTELTDLTGTLARHRERLSSSVADVADVTAEIRKADGSLLTVLQQGPGFLGRVETLVQTARPGLGCLLTAGAAPGPPVFTPKTEATVRHIINLLPTFQALLKDTAVVTPKGTYLRSTALVSIAGPQAAADYTLPVAKPVPPATPRCPATPGTDARGKKPTGDKDAPARTTEAPGPGGATPVPVQNASGESEKGVAGTVLPLLPILLAAGVLITVAGRALRSYLSGR
ncbi:MCE family protein [Actinocorallia longicatena]|uniref:MCE family protein n=1 Tax=Actinocorallia longicatena TaxID=111803 RepID=A0ABP6QR96_9ACTN